MTAPITPKCTTSMTEAGTDQLSYRAARLRNTINTVKAYSIGACKPVRSEEHTSELQSLMRISYAVFCLKKKDTQKIDKITHYKNTKQTNKNNSQIQLRHSSIVIISINRY